MNQQEFVERFEKEYRMFRVFGEYVKTEVLNASSSVGFLEDNFKIIAPPRVKDINSLIEKAFFRNKEYTNPYEEITDKVGVRFVVLTRSQLERLSDSICSLDREFMISKDRDYERERDERPTVFEYQSIHYIVRLRQEKEINNEIIFKNTSCEIQLRTLLQHAYSELTHDTVYKPQIMATKEQQRLAAKSMALIETTDDIFDYVAKSFDNIDKDIFTMIDRITGRFMNEDEFKLEPKLTNALIDSLRPSIEKISESEITSFLNDYSFIPKRVRERAKMDLLFRQPVILLIYFLAYRYQYELRENWPFPVSELNSIFTDIGISSSSF